MGIGYTKGITNFDTLELVDILYCSVVEWHVHSHSGVLCFCLLYMYIHVHVGKSDDHTCILYMLGQISTNRYMYFLYVEKFYTCINYSLWYRFPGQSSYVTWMYVIACN